MGKRPFQSCLLLHFRRSYSLNSSQWHQRHCDDPYTKKALKEGFSSRAAYKLEYIFTKYSHLLLPTDRTTAQNKLFEAKKSTFESPVKILDCGAAPGGWSQWLSRHFIFDKWKIIGQNFQIFAVDKLKLEEGTIAPGNLIKFLQGDIKSYEFKKQLILWSKRLNPSPSCEDIFLDYIMSDLSHNITGKRFSDSHESFVYLRFLMSLCSHFLRPKTGHLIVKQFQGGSERDAEALMKENFEHVKIVHPPASRKESTEFYLVGINYSGEHVPYKFDKHRYR